MPRPGSISDVLIPTAIAFALLGVWGLLLHLRARRDGRKLTVVKRFVPIHALQSSWQAIILLYWGLYWTPLASHVPHMLVQIAYCVAFDALLALTVHRKWSVGYTPLPVVFSTNLFLYYEDQYFGWWFVLYGIVYLGKALVHWRGPRGHIFNPSAFAMAVMTLGFLFVPDMVPTYRGIDHEFWLPPNMVEVLFLVTLTTMWRVPIVLVTLGAYFGFTAETFRGAAPPFVFYPAIFIAIILLIPDPKTSPRTPVGQLLFGYAYGSMVHLWANLGHEVWGHDASAKIVAVPIVNLLVPWLDRLGKKFERPFFAFLDRRYNVIHMAIWIAVVVTAYAGNPQVKSGLFGASGPDHERWENRHVVLEADGSVECASNPAYCEPFSFGHEARLWLGD